MVDLRERHDGVSEVPWRGTLVGKGLLSSLVGANDEDGEIADERDRERMAGKGDARDNLIGREVAATEAQVVNPLLQFRLPSQDLASGAVLDSKWPAAILPSKSREERRSFMNGELSK